MAQLGTAKSIHRSPALTRSPRSTSASARVDPTVRLTIYRCAKLNRSGLAELRRIRDVVRLGHVTRIDADGIALNHGVLPTCGAHVYVNCTAAGMPDRPPRPVFATGRITLQIVRTCQPAFSAAVIARIETMTGADSENNAMAVPIPPPCEELDWARMLLINARNQREWTRNAALSAWMSDSRLDGMFGMISCKADGEARLGAASRQMRGVIGPAVENLTHLLADTSPDEWTGRIAALA